MSHAAVFDRDAWTCHLCGGHIDRTLRNKNPQMVSLDHIIPVCDPDYPGHVWENLAAAHLRCNTVKGGTATPEDWNLYRKLLAVRLAERRWCRWWTPEERSATPQTLSA
ncbi:HNH endonuclease [Streptomyces mirabilis]|uniref:HNH endonuclease n=1 Tax=Streptomyces mirabilis TaxID=68239 RepID=UPI00167E29B8|nr:HNH endonuclease [Streptomyces mirabilis]